MLEGLRRSLAAQAGRIQMMVGRAVLAAVDDDATLQTVQIEMLDEETQDGVEHFQPYGFAAHPHPDAEGIAVAVGGLRGHAVVLAIADRRYRLKGLRAGEVGLYDDLGQSVLLTRDGIVIRSAIGIAMETEGDFSVQADGAVSIQAGGDFSVDASGAAAIRAGGDMLVDGAAVAIGDGASLAAARRTDTVSGGAISTGSSKVKIA